MLIQATGAAQAEEEPLPFMKNKWKEPETSQDAAQSPVGACAG